MLSDISTATAVTNVDMLCEAVYTRWRSTLEVLEKAAEVSWRDRMTNSII